MSNESDYLALLPAIDALAEEDVRTPVIPVSVYLQEAENLYHWARSDRERLVECGLAPERIDSLPIRAGACREAESRWATCRFMRDQAQESYRRLSQEMFTLAEEVVHHMFYAYREHERLLENLRQIVDHRSTPARIQSLSNLAVFGQQHLEPLEASGFDPVRLQVLAEASDDLAELLAVANGERVAGRAAKCLRDKAYTYLKLAVDEIRASGRFRFWRDPTRLRGYRSEYAKRHRSRKGAGQPATVSDNTSSLAHESLPPVPSITTA